MSAKSVDVRSLTFGFRGNVVLRDVSFAVQGGLHSVVGRNGSGKTTLLRVLATALSAPSGQVFLDDVDMGERRGRRQARGGIGFLPQTTRADVGMTARDWLHFGGWLQGLSGSQLREAVATSVEEWDLEQLSRTRMKRLSVGQRRRVDLARSCLNPSATLIVLDEPFAALDEASVELTRSIVAVRAETATVIYSDQGAAWSQASQVLDLS